MGFLQKSFQMEELINYTKGDWAVKWDKTREGFIGVIDKADKNSFRGLPGGAVVENLRANAGDTGSSPGLGRSHVPRSN